MSEPRQTPAPTSGNDPGAPVPPKDTRQQVADLTRQQIERIYENNPPNQPEQNQPHKAPPNNTLPAKSPYARTHKENFDWRNYHSAWQSYYQEYYRRYYKHLEAKKSLEAPAAPTDQPVVGKDERAEELKKDVVSQVQLQAKKIKRSHHFWPVISAVLVGATFLFVQFNSVLIAQVKAYVSPGALEGQSLVINDPSSNLVVGPEPKLIIPKINVDVPVDYTVESLEENTIQTSLENGSTHYKLPGANSLPGEFGNSVILGHSSSDVFAQGKYKYTFVLADLVEAGDVFYLHYNGTRFVYKVTETRVIKPTDIAALQIGYDKPMATIVTCTPAGTAVNRLLIFGEQISPDPAAATKPAETTDATPADQLLPGNAPTLLEQVWGWFF